MRIFSLIYTPVEIAKRKKKKKKRATKQNNVTGFNDNETIMGSWKTDQPLLRHSFFSLSVNHTAFLATVTQDRHGRNQGYPWISGVIIFIY